MLTGFENPCNYGPKRRLSPGSSPAIPAKIRWFQDRLFFLCFAESPVITGICADSDRRFLSPFKAHYHHEKTLVRCKMLTEMLTAYRPVLPLFSSFCMAGFVPAVHSEPSITVLCRPSHDRKGGFFAIRHRKMTHDIAL